MSFGIAEFCCHCKQHQPPAVEVLCSNSDHHSQGCLLAACCPASAFKPFLETCAANLSVQTVCKSSDRHSRNHDRLAALRLSSQPTSKEHLHCTSYRARNDCKSRAMVLIHISIGGLSTPLMQLPGGFHCGQERCRAQGRAGGRPHCSAQSTPFCCSISWHAGACATHASAENFFQIYTRVQYAGCIIRLQYTGAAAAMSTKVCAEQRRKEKIPRNIGVHTFPSLTLT